MRLSAFHSLGISFWNLKKKHLLAPSLKLCELSRSYLAYASVQLGRYIYTICIVHIDELRKSAKVIYVAAVRTCAVRIYRQPVFSRCSSKGYPTTDFIGRIQDITDYLSHLPETQVNRAYSQNISVVKNGSVK